MTCRVVCWLTNDTVDANKFNVIKNVKKKKKKKREITKPPTWRRKKIKIDFPVTCGLPLFETGENRALGFCIQNQGVVGNAQG